MITPSHTVLLLVPRSVALATPCLAPRSTQVLCPWIRNRADCTQMATWHLQCECHLANASVSRQRGHAGTNTPGPVLYLVVTGLLICSITCARREHAEAVVAFCSELSKFSSCDAHALAYIRDRIEHYVANREGIGIHRPIQKYQGRHYLHARQARIQLPPPLW